MSAKRNEWLRMFRQHWNSSPSRGYFRWVSFEVSADAYARFMGRYSEPLAAEFVAQLDLRAGRRVLDVGCGPGALTAQLVGRLGLPSVVAVDPSESFASAIRARIPGIEVQRAPAEHLPFADDEFDAAAAQLVVHFMTDPVAGLTEMARVTRPGGVVAACVWDHAGGTGPLAVFWRAVSAVDPDARDESGLAGARAGHLAELFERAGLRDVESSLLTVHVSYRGFDEWWEPLTLGVGPAGNYIARLNAEQRSTLAEQCAQLLPTGPFEISASAWTARGRA
jgi:SAM-dependent methyltransferase